MASPSMKNITVYTCAIWNTNLFNMNMKPNLCLVQNHMCTMTTIDFSVHSIVLPTWRLCSPCAILMTPNEQWQTPDFTVQMMQHPWFTLLELKERCFPTWMFAPISWYWIACVSRFVDLLSYLLAVKRSHFFQLCSFYKESAPPIKNNKTTISSAHEALISSAHKTTSYLCNL